MGTAFTRKLLRLCWAESGVSGLANSLAKPSVKVHSWKSISHCNPAHTFHKTTFSVLLFFKCWLLPAELIA